MEAHSVKPAAIQAVYADYRRIKGRKCLQIILEVPLEMAPQVHEAFGEPLPDGSTWVAVARLDVEAKQEIRGGKLCQRAAILCGEGAFLAFVSEKTGLLDAEAIDSVEYLRNQCSIQSRRELDHNEEAAKKFIELEASYRAWKSV